MDSHYTPGHDMYSPRPFSNTLPSPHPIPELQKIKYNATRRCPHYQHHFPTFCSHTTVYCKLIKVTYVDEAPKAHVGKKGHCRFFTCCIHGISGEVGGALRLPLLVSLSPFISCRFPTTTRTMAAIASSKLTAMNGNAPLPASPHMPDIEPSRDSLYKSLRGAR